MEELVMQVRWPISDLEALARKKFGIAHRLTDFRVEGDALVLYFTQTPATGNAAEKPTPAKDSIPARRRRRTKRNRMRTRGWKVVAHIENSKGQRCAIYEPFIEALRDPQLSDKERRAKVREVLKSNGNEPTQASVEYYMSNTMDFLAGKGAKE